MTFSSFLLILQRQFTQKWGRFLLASGGIMIGIWAISLTTSLSLGVLQALVGAINSQPVAREISLSKTESSQTNFLEITDAPKFVPIALKDLNNIKSKYSNVVDISPDVTLNTLVHSSKAPSDIKCVEQNIALQKVDSTSANATAVTVDLAAQSSLNENCLRLNIAANSFSRFYETNKNEWIGSTDEPKRGEIVVCFKCRELNFGESMGAKTPEELVGKKITVELQRAPELYEGGKVLDVLNFNAPSTEVKESKNIEFEIKSVVDDRSATLFGGNAIYLDYSYFTDAFEIVNPELKSANYGSIQNTVFIDSYENLDKVVEQLRADNYLIFSLAQTVISGVTTGFLVLSIALSLLGFIALIASVFGIINVMTISVLERQKEIGVLKSLGAKDGDIFRIFLFESSLLGLIGWLFGILLALGTGNLISFIFVQFINSDQSLKNNLESINLSSFSPSFPWWLLLGTLGVALAFTVLSGVFPAIKASKQNPVDVLRSE